MELLKLLNTRYSIAKSFTKKWHEEIKRNIDDYEAKSGSVGKEGKKNGVYNRHVATSRYDITIPYIFATHESMISSFFENMPDIVITGRTSASNDAEMLKAIYAYLVDKADLDEFLGVSAWWFFLVGMVKADVEYKQKISEYVPQLDAMGQPMFDEMGQPVTIPVYEYNDPIATVDNPLKVHFSPDSEFSIDGKMVPYYIKERLVDVDEIKELYDVEVDADESLEVDDVDEKDVQDDLKRAKVLYYFGTLPSSVKDDPKFKKLKLKWSYETNYRIYYTKDAILFAEETKNKPCKLARLYSAMNKFFGFGIGTTLHPFQEDMSVRRSQQLAYADRFAFPWLMAPNGLKVDQKSLMDYQKRNPLTYSAQDGQKPEYLTPPQMPTSVPDADNAMRGDAQFVSGSLDLSKGAQQTNTVKTATGQQLFAQSQDKRLNKARKALAKYYREVVIEMFKLARDNWDDEKKIVYQDDEGNDIEVTVSKADLEQIDFDTDIDFNLDSVSVNQDIMSQRWLGLLEQSVNVPEAKTDKIFKKVLKESYKIPNPDAYVNTPEEMMAKQGGMMPQDPTMPPMQEPPMQEQSETPPMPQTMGSQLAPQAPYVG